MSSRAQSTQPFILPPTIPWSEVTQRYFTFAASLPPPLDQLAVDRHVFIGKGASVPIHSLADVHPLVTCLPWLFAEAFPTVAEAELLDITEAGVLLSMGLLLYDAYQDHQLSNHAGIALLHQQLTFAALRKLQGLFDAQSSFWGYFSTYFYEYTQALLLEKEHCGQVTAYPLELMYKIGSGKVALFKTTTTALALKGQAASSIAQLSKAVDLLAAAMQLGDDIVDWPEDYARQNYTLPLTQAIPPPYWPLPDLAVEEVGRQFERSVILERLMAQVVEWFQDSVSAVGELQCPHWVAFVDSCLTLTKNYQAAFVARKVLKLFSATFSLEPRA